MTNIHIVFPKAFVERLTGEFTKWGYNVVNSDNSLDTFTHWALSDSKENEPEIAFIADMLEGNNSPEEKMMAYTQKLFQIRMKRPNLRLILLIPDEYEHLSAFKSMFIQYGIYDFYYQTKFGLASLKEWTAKKNTLMDHADFLSHNTGVMPPVMPQVSVPVQEETNVKKASIVNEQTMDQKTASAAAPPAQAEQETVEAKKSSSKLANLMNKSNKARENLAKGLLKVESKKNAPALTEEEAVVPVTEVVREEKVHSPASVAKELEVELAQATVQEPLQPVRELTKEKMQEPANQDKEDEHSVFWGMKSPSPSEEKVLDPIAESGTAVSEQAILIAEEESSASGDFFDMTEKELEAQQSEEAVEEEIQEVKPKKQVSVQPEAIKTFEKKSETKYVGVTPISIAFVGLSAQAGTSFHAMNLARYLGNQGYSTGLFENPVFKPGRTYLSDVLGLEEFNSLPHKIATKGAVPHPEGFYQDDSITYYITDAQQQPIHEFSYEDYTRMVNYGKQAFRIYDMGTMPEMADKEEYYKSLLMMFDKVVVVVDIMPHSFLANQETYIFMRELEREWEEGRVRFILNRADDSIPRKELKKVGMFDAHAFPTIPIHLIYKAMFSSLIPLDIEEIHDRLYPHYTDLVDDMDLDIQHQQQFEKKQKGFLRRLSFNS